MSCMFLLIEEVGMDCCIFRLFGLREKNCHISLVLKPHLLLYC